MCSMSLNEAIEDLGWRFMSLEEYDAAVKSGKLPSPYSFVGGDAPFTQRFPDHPLNHLNRFRRLDAADTIMRIAETRRSAITPEALEKIHCHLFDCCAGVRHSLTTVLFLAGDRSSLPFLKRLLEYETAELLEGTGSRMVRKACRSAMARLNPPEVATVHDTIFAVTPDIDLAGDLFDLCNDYNLKLYIGEPESPDPIAVPCTAAIIDEEWLGPKSFKSLLNFLKECRGQQNPYLLVIVAPSVWPERASQALESIHRPVLFVHCRDNLPILQAIKSRLKGDLS